MRLSLREQMGLCLVGGGLLLLAASAWANTPAATNGNVSVFLTHQLYCDARGLLTGNLGLIAGLLLVVLGLWSLVTGGGWFKAVLAIIIGGVFPSIPGLVEGFFIGLGSLLQEANMLGGVNRPFTPPNCPAPPLDPALRAEFDQARARELGGSF